MKILHISDHLPGYHKIWGGAEQVAYRYVKLLAEGKDEIVVGGTKPDKDIQENFRFRRIRVLEDYVPQKYQVYITGLKNRIISFDPVAFVHLLMILNREKPDIVHFHKFNKISFSAILASKICGAKLVMGMYDYWYLCPGGMLIDSKRSLCRKFHGKWCSECDAVKEFRFLMPLMSSLRKQIFNFFLNKIDAFAVLSNFQGELLIEYGIPKKKIFLVRQVFDLDIPLKLSSRLSKKKKILFIGWIDPRKGPDIAIKTTYEIAKKIPSIELNIIGTGLDQKYEKVIKDFVGKLRIRDKIIFWGRQPQEKIKALYNECRVVLLPEQWENMSPVVLVEAMMYGKPVVSSSIGGLTEFIRNGKSGYLVDRSNVNEFARKTMALLQNKSLADKIGKSARQDMNKICNIGEVSDSLKRMYLVITKKI